MINKRQRRNREILKNVYIFNMFFEMFLLLGIVGNIELDIAIPKHIVILIIINTIMFLLLNIIAKEIKL